MKLDAIIKLSKLAFSGYKKIKKNKKYPAGKANVLKGIKAIKMLTPKQRNTLFYFCLFVGTTVILGVFFGKIKIDSLLLVLSLIENGN